MQRNNSFLPPKYEWAPDMLHGTAKRNNIFKEIMNSNLGNRIMYLYWLLDVEILNSYIPTLPM